ncbi:MAG: FkbM family methyltransferase [Pedobacter sp.]
MSEKYKVPIKEKIMFIGEQILDQFIKIPAFQRYVNRRANNKYGMRFVKFTTEIDDVFYDYRFFDIRKNDVVLDIGANVGAFSLFVSKFVKKVVAVEPFADQLRQNIELNDAKNITVIDDALGKHGMIQLKWLGQTKTVQSRRLCDLINMTGGHVDFIKMDCEGGEWNIEAHELTGVRRIEAEIHNLDGDHDPRKFLAMLDGCGFVYDFEVPRSGIVIVHAWRIW